nr:hypothetical protein [uncultured Halomonas sp.]
MATGGDVATADLDDGDPLFPSAHDECINLLRHDLTAAIAPDNAAFRLFYTLAGVGGSGWFANGVNRLLVDFPINAPRRQQQFATMMLLELEMMAVRKKGSRDDIWQARLYHRGMRLVH